MDHLEQIIALAESLRKDKQKFFDKGNESAGIRLRKGLLEIRAVAHDLRKITLNKNG